MEPTTERHPAIVALKEAVRKRNLAEERSNAWVIHGNTIQPLNEFIPKDGYPMDFDHIFDRSASNKMVFESVVLPILNGVVEGYNGTVFAYGPTASGKWHTMEGTVGDAGMIPRAIEEIFKIACQDRKNDRYLIRCSYFMVHYNKIYDLMTYVGKEADITRYSNAITIAAREAVVSTKDQAFDLLNLGLRNRSLYVKHCKLNIKHCDMIFRLIVEHEIKSGTDTSLSFAHLNLVTLGGSERVDRPADFPRFVERDFVNKYLASFVSMMTNTVAEESVDYTDSILNTLFANVFGGNTKIAVIATFLNTSVENTHFTLNFANKVKQIQNKPTINITEKNSLLRQVLSQMKDYYEELETVKMKCARLSTVGQVMQEIDLFHDRIKLLKLALVKPIDESHNFNNLLLKVEEMEFSPLELRLINVLLANKSFSALHVGKKIKMPFEMLYGTLSNEVGNNLITPTPENFTEILLVPHYIIETKPDCETDMPHSDEDTEGDFTADITDISCEYSALEKSITSRIQNKELKAEIDNLSALFIATYSEQVSINRDIGKQNEMLIAEVAELKLQLSSQDRDKCHICQRLSVVEHELTSQNRPVVADQDLRREYDFLLAQVDRKDTEYFALQREKADLEKRIKKLAATIKKYKAPSHAYEKLDSTDSNITLLQSEVQTLQQKITDQDFVMEEMSAKHKRREEELLRRVQEKDLVQGRVYSTFKNTEKQVQASPRLEDTTAQTEEMNLGLDVALQTEKLQPDTVVEDAGAQTEKSPTKDVSFQTNRCVVIPLPPCPSKTDISITENSQEVTVTDVNFTSLASVPSTSNTEELTTCDTTLSAEEEECLSDMKKCQSVIEKNQTLLKNVKELHVLYVRDISKGIKRNPKLHVKMRRKEEELFQVKAELQIVEGRLRDTKKELCMLKDKSTSDRLIATQQVEAPKTAEGCTSCTEMSVKIETLQKKLADLKAIEAASKFRVDINYHKKQLDYLSRSSQDLNETYMELKEDYENLLKEFEAQLAAKTAEQEPDPNVEQKDPHCEIG